MNHLRVAILASCFFGAGILLAFSWLGYFGLLLSTLLLGGISAYVYFFFSRILLACHGAEPFVGGAAAEVSRIIHRIALQLNLPTPSIYLTADHNPCCFSVGNNPYNAAVVLSQGLLDLLTLDELETVLAFEMVEIENGHIFFRGLAAAVLFYTFSALGFGSRRRNLATALVSGLLWVLLMPFARILMRVGLRRSQVFQGDRQALKLCNSRGANYVYAQALQKISRHFHVDPVLLRVAVSRLYIVNPVARFAWGQEVRELLAGDFNRANKEPMTSERVTQLLKMV